MRTFIALLAIVTAGFSGLALFLWLFDPVAGPTQAKDYSVFPPFIVCAVAACITMLWRPRRWVAASLFVFSLLATALVLYGVWNQVSWYYAVDESYSKAMRETIAAGWRLLSSAGVLLVITAGWAVILFRLHRLIPQT
jgi:hypothetical protein